MDGLALSGSGGENGPAPQERKVYTVSELTSRIRHTLEDQVGLVWVEGEISNLRRPTSGHLYFTLKDDAAQLAAVLFRGTQRTVSLELRDGLQVRLFGEVTAYERSSQYQLIVRRIEPGGKGVLWARFEALKEKLAREGLFDPKRKKPLPVLPQHVAVVTSPTGAAIRDILKIIQRRFPNLHVGVCPVRVQGEGAAQEIADAVDWLNRLGRWEVIIVGRGGGSLEDLWAFNEEVVARAIARSRIPVISAVGHEVDWTISDLVADVRAPTPSAAAEMVVHRKDTLEEKIANLHGRLIRALREEVLRARSRLLSAAGSPVFSRPATVVARYLQRLDTAELRLHHAVKGSLAEGRRCLDEMDLRMQHQVTLTLSTLGQEVRRLAGQLAALDPLAVLARGYSVTTDSQGRMVTRFDQVQPGDRIRTRLARGELESRVETGREGGGEHDAKPHA